MRYLSVTCTSLTVGHLSMQANGQLEKRVKSLNGMLTGLHSFHGKVDDFDNWLAEADREMSDIKRAVARNDHLEMVMDTFQVIKDLSNN